MSVFSPIYVRESMQLVDLNIENEENENLVLEEGVEGEAEVNRFELCLVGQFLTEKNINGRAMPTKSVDLWKPAMGINIKDLKPEIIFVPILSQR